MKREDDHIYIARGKMLSAFVDFKEEMKKITTELKNKKPPIPFAQGGFVKGGFVKGGFVKKKPSFKPCVIWFTGLSGAGKTTLATMLYNELIERGIKAAHLDGDKIREVFPQTGFSKEERDTHIRRIGYTASILEAHGITVVCSFISPYKSSRNFVRTVCRDYKEILVNTPLRVCERRDPKGLYKKAREGRIINFTGIDDPYEEPENPFYAVMTHHYGEDETKPDDYTEDYTPEESLQTILDKLKL